MEIKLTITFNQQTNQIRLDGPLQDKLFCYGLLRAAEYVIHDQQPSPIVVPNLKVVGRNDKSN